MVVVGREKNVTNMASKVLAAFANFLSCVQEKKSFLYKEEIQNLFTIENVEKAYNEYRKKYKELLTGKQKKNPIVKMEEITEVLKDADDNVKHIINHAEWLWALPNNKRNNTPFEIKDCTLKEEAFNDEIIKGVAGGGSGYVQYKSRAILFVLYLFSKLIEENAVLDIKSHMLILCKQIDKENYEKDNDTIPEGFRNLLMYLCAPDKYEPIASDKDKERIISTFSFLIGDDRLDTDTKIKKIRNGLKGKCGFNENDSLYKGNIGKMWKSYSDSDISLAKMLELKKALILYGPPGTGKTYTARELATQLAISPHMKVLQNPNENEKKEDAWKSIDAILSGKDSIDDCLKNLQLHINYSYEDFMVGQTIEENSVVIKPGFIFDAIKKANENDELGKPYVIILDEINRTDVSRVFGELFSAMEMSYRGKRYDLPYRVDSNSIPKGYEEFFDNDGRMHFTIPNNLYFIGTMNEIDFSLERVDFALRRRFLWHFAGYNDNALYEMLDEDKDKVLTNEKDKSDYITSCNNLNNIIIEDKALGAKYEIGHAFFAMPKILYAESGNNLKKAKKLLWQISILPTIEAYCGSMDEDTQKALVEKCKKAFIG